MHVHIHIYVYVICHTLFHRFAHCAWPVNHGRHLRPQGGRSGKTRTVWNSLRVPRGSLGDAVGPWGVPGLPWRSLGGSSGSPGFPQGSRRHPWWVPGGSPGVPTGDPKVVPEMSQGPRGSPRGVLFNGLSGLVSSLETSRHVKNRNKYYTKTSEIIQSRS